MATKKIPSGKPAPKKPAPKKAATTKAATTKATPKSMPKAGKDPRGGLTAKGRSFFNATEGSHLRPGVKGPANTPEKMKRKGSFLTRHYTHPRGPVVRDGEPTRQALQAAAWGEPIPRTEADEKKLAAKGRDLLDKFHQARGDAPAPRRSRPARKLPPTPSS